MTTPIPYKPTPAPTPTKAEEAAKAALRASARTHLGQLAKPVGQ